jgi:hypothetical protein
MKRWAFLTVVLYAFVVSFLTVPILLLLGDGDGWEYVGGFFAFFLPILVLIQVVLLLIPVSAVQARPVAKRTVVSSAAIGAFPLAVLLTCFVWFILLMIFGEETAMAEWLGWGNLSLLFCLWVFWGVLFYRRFSPESPGSLTEAITRWLLAGSILEILVAIPSHILSRHRDECCAPGFTLFGLVTGISLAVMAFGPGVFLLLAARVKEKRMAQSQ